MTKLKLILTGLILAVGSQLAPSIPESLVLKPVNAEDLVCLARNVYHEARGESIKGQVAVALVTMNRVNDAKFPKTVCGVVYSNRQFSWTHKPQPRYLDERAWSTSIQVAQAVLSGSARIPGFIATHYHTRFVNPHWNREMRVVKVIDNHIFYA